MLRSIFSNVYNAALSAEGGRIILGKIFDLFILVLVATGGYWVTAWLVLPEIRATGQAERLTRLYERQQMAVTDALVAVRALEDDMSLFATRETPEVMYHLNDVDPDRREEYRSLFGKVKLVETHILKFGTSDFLDEMDVYKLLCLVKILKDELNKGRGGENYNPKIVFAVLLADDLKEILRSHEEAADHDMTSVQSMRSYEPKIVLSRHSAFFRDSGVCFTPDPGSP